MLLSIGEFIDSHLVKGHAGAGVWQSLRRHAIAVDGMIVQFSIYLWYPAQLYFCETPALLCVILVSSESRLVRSSMIGSPLPTSPTPR